MTDYISREAFKAEIRRLSTHYLNEWDTLGVLAAADRIPAADVRPVVLCRDCVMYECHEYDGGLKYVCRLFKRQMQEMDFCSYGEKREES